MSNEKAVTLGAPFPRNYSAELLTLTRGEGVYLEDSAGTRYLDFGAGIAVNALGHGRDDLAEIAAAQMKKVIHVSNLYTTPPALELARRLVSSRVGASEKEFAAVHFGNSGAEANEAAIKYACLYALATRGENHHKILSLSHGFHGRTMGALSATPSIKYQKKFLPLVPGMEAVPMGDIAALEETLNATFAAVIVEVVQGEGGLAVMSRDYAELLNRLTAELDVLLIADEVQTGLSRLGCLYGSELVGLKPDIVTLSKPRAGGLPLSATLIPTKVNEQIELGDHGTTFGGGPVTTAVAAHVWDLLSDPAFIETVREKGEHLGARLEEIAGRHERVGQVRGAGMLRGIEITGNQEEVATAMSDIMAEARRGGLLILRSGSNVLRIAPPLVITREEIDRGVELLERAVKHVVG